MGRAASDAPRRLLLPWLNITMIALTCAHSPHQVSAGSFLPRPLGILLARQTLPDEAFQQLRPGFSGHRVELVTVLPDHLKDYLANVSRAEIAVQALHHVGHRSHLQPTMHGSIMPANSAAPRMQRLPGPTGAVDTTAGGTDCRRRGHTGRGPVAALRGETTDERKRSWPWATRSSTPPRKPQAR